MQLKSTCGPRTILSRFTIMLRIGLIASSFALLGQSQASIILKSVEINAVMKIKDGNCVGISIITLETLGPTR